MLARRIKAVVEIVFDGQQGEKRESRRETCKAKPERCALRRGELRRAA